MVTQGARKCVLVVVAEFIYLTVKYFQCFNSMIIIKQEVPISAYYLLLPELITTVDTLCKDGMLIGPEALMSVWCWAG